MNTTTKTAGARPKAARPAARKVPKARPAAAPVAMPSLGEQGALASTYGNGPFFFVSPAKDLVAKGDIGGDSWYVISHVSSGQRKFDVLIHYASLMLPTEASFLEGTITVFDHATKKYLVEDKPYAQSECTLSATELDVQTPMGGLKGPVGAMQLTGTTPRITAAFALANQGHVLANMGNGVIPFYGEFQYQFSLPNLATTGTLTIDGETFEVAGTSWLDRQWGNAGPSVAHRKWTWLGMSLDNGDFISLWDMLEPGIEHAYATVLHPDGRLEIVAVEPVANGASAFWKSPASGNTYPTHLEISIPQLNAQLTVEALVREQEIISTIPHANKYEGACRVSGTLGGQPIGGRAVLEQVGNWR